MKFKWKLIGNERVVEFLDKSLINNNIANFYIFSGCNGLGKFTLAKNFIQNVFLNDKPELEQLDNFLETNSDFFVVEREDGKKNISIDQIRKMIERFKSSSFLNSYRVAIIKNAESLNENSANALLKLLEDVNKKIVIILTVNDIDNLPKTIISRGQVVNFSLVRDDLIYQGLINDFGASPSLAKNLARLSLGRPAMALKFLQAESYYQDYQSIVFDFLNFFNANFSQRIKIIDEIVGKNDILNNFNILEIWQSVIRDLFFINYGQYDLIKNEFAVSQFKDIQTKNLSLLELRDKSLIINKGSEYLSSNINFKSVLEYVAVNI